MRLESHHGIILSFELLFEDNNLVIFSIQEWYFQREKIIIIIINTQEPATYMTLRKIAVKSKPVESKLNYWSVESQFHGAG